MKMEMEMEMIQCPSIPGDYEIHDDLEPKGMDAVDPDKLNDLSDEQ